LSDRFAALIATALPKSPARPALGDTEFLLRIDNSFLAPLRAG